MRRWECVGDGSAKFWEGSLDGCAVTVRYGKVGAAGRTQVKTLESEEAAARHLARAVAEKEAKGYREVAPAAAPSLSAGEPAVPAGPVFPDESTFAMPAAWRRVVQPRRGGLRQRGGEPAADAVQMVQQRLKEESGWVEEVLDAPLTDQGIADAVRMHLTGSPHALGAASLATLTSHWRLPAGVFVDAWVEQYGLPFAARAVVELMELEAHWRQWGSQRTDPWLAHRTATGSVSMHGICPSSADRARALLAQADEATHREATAALADCRRTTRNRVVVSYLLPDRQDWLADCLDDPAARATEDPLLRSMLLRSVDSPEQLAQVESRADLGWTGWSVQLIATVAERVGDACTPLVGEAVEHAQGSDRLRTFAGALVELPTDEAFGLLLVRADDKQVRPALLEAMRRYPVRALRLLATAVLAPGTRASSVQRLLAAHVRAHRELSAAALPALAAEIVALVEPLLTDRDRVPDAPVDTLPELLVTPPWLRRRTPRRPQVVAGLQPAEEHQVVWLTGERERWAALGSWYGELSDPVDWEAAARELTSGRRRNNAYYAGKLLLHGPVEVMSPALAVWSPDSHWGGERAFKPIVARYESAALRLALELAAGHPVVLAQLLLPFLDLGAARLMADWLVRLKSTGRTARSWFTRHGAGAARLLVPDAVGAPGAARQGAEQALRLIAAVHGSESVTKAAAGYGEEAAAAVADLLAADPLENALPAKMPVIGPWADPALLPQIVLTRGGALPDDAVRHVLTMLALSRPGEAYLGIEQVTSACTADSLAEFAWVLFEEWRLAGMPAKDSWALNALGVLGDDDTVRRLTPVLRGWPGEGAHHRAVEGLGVLAAIGSDLALLHLHGIAQRVKFKALKVRAKEKIAEVAEGLGLSGEQLSDRLVPDLGLDTDGTTVIDYGPRRFTVGFDEQLRPYVLDADGRRRKDLPAPGARDDAELAPAERKRYAALKKDVRTIAADQVARLETAMVAQRSWTAAEFRELFVGHPLLWHLVRRLVWLCDADGRTTAFRIAEDRTFADVDDEELTLPAQATVRLAHPLLLGQELRAWSELFADYEILQPFPQLGRPVLTLTAEEAADHRLRRFEGATVPVGKLLGLQRRGWERGTPQDAGIECWFSKPLADNRHLVIGLDTGIAVGIVNEFPDQLLSTIWLGTHPDHYRQSREYPLRFGDLHPVTACELLADLAEVTGR
ncbi:DUF4132 domain-containing protein [Peterkaempfera sp. SMS 1(5)a]|uniref:DUF4132 domain-containing protein n=1 Tax=Peterkaempfera podocarpi TaxID=3232308 RepID=UPI003672D544